MWKSESMSGPSCTNDYGENNNIIGMDLCGDVERQTKKRKCDVTSEHVPPALMSGRQFVLLSKNSSTFVTTDWKETGSSLFLPLKADTFVNMQRYEQLTVTDGNFFVADEAGTYSSSVRGKVLHLWKYCKTKREYFVAESFLFTNPQEFSVVLNHLYMS